MRKLLLAVFLLAVPAMAQVARYSATTGDVSFSGGTKLTIQQPAANAKQVQFETAVVYCSVACDVSQAQNGTAATATPGTAVPIQPTPASAPAVATVWTASNVGGGTAVGGVFHLPALAYLVLDLSKVSLGNGGTANNYTIAIATASGTGNMTIYWSER